jgi:hypothetical protein
MPITSSPQRMGVQVIHPLCAILRRRDWCSSTTQSHGTQDSVLQYSGGVSMAQNFAKANGCTWATPTEATGNHVCTNLTGCMPGYPVEFCSFVGPHTPDPSDGGGGSWEYQNVWTFFSQF